MEREERWQDENPWLDHVRVQEQNHVRRGSVVRLALSRLATRFRNSTQDAQEYFSQQARPLREKILNTFDLSTLAETSLYSVSMMLISFVIFWMFFISAILAGSLLTLTFLITIAIKSGRRIRRFASNIRTRSNAAPVAAAADSAQSRTTSTSAATPDSNY